MAGFFYDETALQVLQGFRPYLGPRGNGCLIALENLLKLLLSEPARKTLDALQILGPGEGFKTLTMPGSPERRSSLVTLFLLQALLVLADAPGVEEAVPETELDTGQKAEIGPETVDLWQAPE